MRHELQVAITVAHQAGQLQLKMQSSAKSRISKGGLDFATKADVDSQKMITDALVASFPDIPIIAEEDDPQATQGDRFWVVDPIDGTVDYAEGGESWGSLIALIENGQPTLGVAYQPARKVTVAVEDGGGCLLNDIAVQLQYTKPFKNAVIGTEVGWWCNESYFVDFLHPLSQQCQGVSEHPVGVREYNSFARRSYGSLCQSRNTG